MLSEFYIVSEDFENELKACNKIMAKWQGRRHIQHQRLLDLGQDMLSFRESFARAHINATMWFVDEANEMSRGLSNSLPDFEDYYAYVSGARELSPNAKEAVEQHIETGRQIAQRMIRRQKSRAGMKSQESAWELKAAYKAYFFFIRAFQDACCGVLLNLVGSTPGQYTSMRKAVEKQSSPIHAKVIAIPGYVQWFTGFKQKRDFVKVGVEFSLCGPQWDVGVGFNTATPDGGTVIDISPNGNKFRLGDLITAFRYSTALVAIIKRDVPHSNDSLEPDNSEPGAS